jgi:type II secretory pathway component PulK
LVDNKLHTVILRTHPSKHGQHIRFEYTDESGRTCGTTRSFTQHRFLFDDFVNKFTFAADSKEVRESEVQACQQLAQKLTVELSEAMTNPERMKEIIAERLEKEQTEKREQTQYSTRDD